MRILNLLTLTIALLFGVASGLQAQCQASYTWNANGNTVTLVANAGNMNPATTTYVWDYGDNNQGTGGPTNVYTYANTGLYLVCLTAIDASSGCSITYCDSLWVGNVFPCAGFSSTFVYTANGNVVNFTSGITGGTPAYTYSWNFGDGTSSTQANPVHTYANASSYGVYLVVTDANGCVYTYYDTVTTTINTPCTQNEVILVLNFDNYAYETSWDLRGLNGNIVASGSGYTPNQNGSSLTQTFCLPAGCYTFNIYDTYGDGICCLYGQGDYSLTDVATGVILASGGAFAYTETSTICVGGATSPCTGFTAAFTSTSNGNVVNFAASSNGLGTQYLWDFGDNTTGTGANPVHTYANTTNTGTYNVCVTAIDSPGCQTTVCQTVTVAAAPCSNNQVTLVLNLDNFASETTWDITDANGAVLYSGGGYNQNNNGTTIYQNFCLPAGCYNLNLYDSFGDGICCQWGQGSYMLVDANNGILASGGSFGYVDNTNFCVGGATNPCAYFYNNTFTYTVTPNGVVSFVPQTGGPQSPLSYFWDFGNGSTSTLYNPTVTFPLNGTYQVCLTADSAGCRTIYCANVMIGNSGNPNGTPCANMSAYINMTQSPNNPFVISMQPVVNGAIAGAGIDFVWDFGDNTGAISGAPAHQYTSFGSFVVCLMAIDSVNGCIATYCDTITIDSAGNFSRTLNYKDVKPGFLVNIQAPVINFFTAVNAVKNENMEISLFPNPANDVINLLINSNKNLNGTVSILDIAGKTIQQQAVTAAAGQQQVTLSVNNLAAGVYLVKITSETTQQTMKFIKE